MPRLALFSISVITLIVLILVVEAVVVDPLLKEPGTHQSVKQKGEKTKNGHSPTNEAISGVEQTRSPIVEGTRQNTAADTDEKLKIDRQLAEYTKQLSRFTFWLVVVTAILAYVGIRQELHLRDTAKKELRAYIAIKEAKLFRLGPNHVQANVTISNSGRTPAKNVTKQIKAKIMQRSEGFPPPELQPHTMTLAADGEWVFRDDIVDISDEVINDLINRKRDIFVWGRAAYTDIFGNKQWADFRFINHAAHMKISFREVNGKTVSIIEAITGWDLEPEADGNETT